MRRGYELRRETTCRIVLINPVARSDRGVLHGGGETTHAHAAMMRVLCLVDRRPGCPGASSVIVRAGRYSVDNVVENRFLSVPARRGLLRGSRALATPVLPGMPVAAAGRDETLSQSGQVATDRDLRSHDCKREGAKIQSR